MKLHRLAILLLAVSCSEGQPCTDCPPIEGTWFLQYVAPDFPCDGGTLAAPQMTVSFTREGSVVRAAIDGVQLNGTLYDSYDFSLSGQMPGGSLFVQVRGIYTASGADAGGETLTSGRLARSTNACREDRRFTGTRY